MPAILGRPQPREVVELPRSTVSEHWMDVTATAWETRRDLGAALAAHHRGRDPRPHLFDADRRLIRLTDFARQRAGEAEGISYIAPGQVRLPLPDGCGPDGQSA